MRPSSEGDDELSLEFFFNDSGDRGVCLALLDDEVSRLCLETDLIEFSLQLEL